MKTASIIMLLATTVAAANLFAADVPEKTVANLNAAFRGESNASHRYAIFAKKADEEGFAQVAKLFRAASMAEAIHRDTHKKAIETLGGKADQFALDEVKPGSTKENLADAIKGESYERDTMYPDFIKQAKGDHATAAIRSMTFALSAEAEHAKLYQQALDTLGKNAAADYFVCKICGYTVTALPEKKCVSCRNSKDEYVKVS